MTVAELIAKLQTFQLRAVMADMRETQIATTKCDCDHESRVRAFYSSIMDAPEAFCPSITFMHDDKDAFPDGYWELRRFNAIDINAPDTVWRGLTLADALSRAEKELA